MPMSRVAVLGLTIAVLAAAVGCTRPADEAAGHLTGVALAGPTCPVVTDPPQPGCEDRPVAGATVLVVDERGEQVARATTGDDGRFALELPPATYELQPQPVDGILGTAPPVTVTVSSDEPAEVTIGYDTGIR
jgi:hypothetical protein